MTTTQLAYRQAGARGDLAALLAPYRVAERYGEERAIMRLPDGSHRVYRADAWQAPDVPGFLPWSAPPFAPVATVATDGTVTPC